VKDRGLTYRILLVLGVTLAAVVFLLPSLVGGDSGIAGFLPNQRIRLGLDLQGGTHLVLTVRADKAIENSLELVADDLRRELRKSNVQVKQIERTDGDGLRISIATEAAEKLREVVEDRAPNLSVGEPEPDGEYATFQLTLKRVEAEQMRESAVEQSLETIRNRIDQFGVTEPIIQRQGQRDILVQLPGIQDPQRAKDLIGRTAVLHFKLLREGVDPQAYTDGKKPPPAGTQILYGIRKDELGGRRRGEAYVVESRTLMTGDVLTDARVRPGDLPNSRVVLMDFNARGARLFEEITGANVQRRLAIILDDTVYSAPVIRERIGGGRAQIEGNFTPEEARDLTIVLRAGALPAPVEVAEERTVGPSLGRDSVRQGLISFAVAGSFVVVFMILYYRAAGVLADLALIFNIGFLLAALTALEATLTLPGIAGIVLTMGMAVDANVLINERIREELRLGKTARAAIEAGYERALPAILDSNITTFLAGVILFQFGSGPIRGFAVTLCIGLISTVFTAVVCTRVVYDYLLSRRRLQTVSV
jgi:preprotein translocase subunit SecD